MCVCFSVTVALCIVAGWKHNKRCREHRSIDIKTSHYFCLKSFFILLCSANPDSHMITQLLNAGYDSQLSARTFAIFAMWHWIIQLCSKRFLFFFAEGESFKHLRIWNQFRKKKGQGPTFCYCVVNSKSVSSKFIWEESAFCFLGTHDNYGCIRASFQEL